MLSSLASLYFAFVKHKVFHGFFDALFLIDVILSSLSLIFFARLFYF